MRAIQLHNREYDRLEAGFKEWLTVLQHHTTTIEGSPVKIREFLHWLEGQGIKSVTGISEPVVSGYMAYLSHRRNQRRQGGLSANYLNKHISSLKQFSAYLQHSREQGFGVNLPTYKAALQRQVLSVEEVRSLYEATTPDAMGLRDRAILGIYYGCGLRRSEGVALDVDDLLTRKRLLYVRKGKNYRERYVPVTGRVFDDLTAYLESGRPYFGGTGRALLVSRLDKRINAQSVLERLYQLKAKAGIDKAIGLHSLRHSIATHLLGQGMKLSDIARFLGHRSMESTQIYTHLSSDLSSEMQ